MRNLSILKNNALLATTIIKYDTTALKEKYNKIHNNPIKLICAQSLPLRKPLTITYMSAYLYDGILCKQAHYASYKYSY